VTLNNSATRATIYKRICVCESPRDKLSCKKNLCQKFQNFAEHLMFVDHGEKNSNARQNAKTSKFDMKICLHGSLSLGLSHKLIRL
jgi:hypothetical protein